MSPDLRPHLGIDRQSTHTPGFGVEKGSVMVQLSVAEEPRQHCECARGKGLVDERLLPIKCFDCRTTWQRIFAGRIIDDLRIQLADGAQPCGGAPIPRVQRLSEYVLPAC